MQVAILVISACSLLVGAAALWVAVQNHRRSRERSDVRFVAARAEQNDPGRFHVHNQGTDTAYDVTVEAWTDYESATVRRREVGPDEYVEITLPCRSAGKVEPVELLTDHAPPPPPDPFFEAVRRSNEEMRRQRVEMQVNVHVSYRSRRGVWSTDTDLTG